MPSYHKKSLRSRIQLRTHKHRGRHVLEMRLRAIGAARRNDRVHKRAASLVAQNLPRAELRSMGRTLGLTSAQMGNQKTVSDAELCRLIAEADPK